MEKILKNSLYERIGDCHFLDYCTTGKGKYLVYYREIGGYPTDTKTIKLNY